METAEELLAYFKHEISERSEKELKAMRHEIDRIKEDARQAYTQAAEEAAQRWYEQEAAEERLEHAIKMSHLNDENHRHLMEERTALVEQLFDKVKTRLCVFRKQKQYEQDLEDKIKKLREQDLFPAILYVGKEDEHLLETFVALLKQGCTGQIDTSIQYGGFRLVAQQKGRIVDETYDRALEEAKNYFLQTSGLTIC